MFYEEKSPDPNLRFGDVVRGFVIAEPNMKPAPAADSQPESYKVEILQPRFAVVLTPCCSIGDKRLTLTTFLPIHRDWLKNPYFLEDLTNLNRVVPPEKAIPPEKLATMSDEEKEQRLDRSKPGGAFVHVEFFVYAPHPHLGEYSRTLCGEKHEIGHWAIDFRRLYNVSCDEVVKPERTPVRVKVLQLSVDARDELRHKMLKYFSRKAEEDMI